jgi:2-hydroxyacyl-CoA lyase 1
LHFGKQPRFKVDVMVIQVDISPEEFGTNIHIPNSVYLWGHLPLVVSQLISAFKARGVESKIGKQAWWDLLNAKCAKNKGSNAALMKDEEMPMSYYRAFAEIKSVLPENIFLVSEGANTMDIARTILSQHYPRSRLDAGSFGTMGVGLGFAIAAQIAEPERQVVCIQGDSAFGFSAMEIETVCRLGLPILFIIINNNGIYAGMDEKAFKEWSGQHPSTTLSPSARYEQLATAFGGNGYFCQTPDETRKAVDKCIKERKEGKGKCNIINVIISPYGVRKQQEFDWLTRSDPKI